MSLVFREMWDSATLAPHLPQHSEWFPRRPRSCGKEEIRFDPELQRPKEPSSNLVNQTLVILTTGVLSCIPPI